MLRLSYSLRVQYSLDTLPVELIYRISIDISMQWGICVQQLATLSAAMSSLLQHRTTFKTLAFEYHDTCIWRYTEDFACEATSSFDGIGESRDAFYPADPNLQLVNMVVHLHSPIRHSLPIKW
jgi:hypothetical protein